MFLPPKRETGTNSRRMVRSRPIRQKADDERGPPRTHAVGISWRPSHLTDAERLQAFRRVRDAIRARLRESFG
jgi:hypothetical protein